MAYARRDIRGGAVQTTITGDITSNGTSCNLTANTGWPDGSTNGSFYVVVDPGTASEEKILCSTRSSLTVNFTTRGADGTTASAHSAGAVIYPCITAVDADEANYAVAQTVGKVTTSGDLLVASAANAFARLAKGSNSTVFQVSSGGTVQWATAATAMIADNAVTNAKLAGMTRGRVKVGDSGGAASDLALGTSGYFLKSDGTDVVWAAGVDWTTVMKVSDETVTSSAALQDDNELLFTATNAVVYAFKGAILMSRAVGTDPTFKITFGEDNTTTRGSAVVINNDGTVATGSTAKNTSIVTGTAMNASQVYLLSFNGVHTGAGGTFKVVWAQGTSSSAGLTFAAHSYIAYKAIG